jgi:uncharacterized protein (DUF4415 family)
MSKPLKKAPATDAQPDAEMVQFMADLEQSLQEAHAGLGRVTPAQIAARRRGRPVGSVQATTKEAVKLRLDADVLAALRASGDGWQTRVNDTLRASLHLAGRV